MKLIDAKIFNFGKFSNYEYSFNSDLTKIIENNGWGKTTLSDFICIMLYGFKDENKKKKEDREREKYRPWQGGDYGGIITFEVKNNKYSATRLFGDKESEDKFVLKDLNKKTVSKDYSTNLGIELFDLDRESFERTIYIDQNGCHTSITSSISAKLGNLIDNTDDINNFETADENLKSLINSMNPKTKKGSISRLENEIYDLSLKTEDKIKVLNELEEEKKKKQEKENELTELTKSLNLLKEEQNRLSKQKDLQTKKQKVQDLENDLNVRKNKVELDRLSFPLEVPNIDELSNYIDLSSKLNKMLAEANVFKLNEDQEEQYNKLKEMFLMNPTSLEEISSYKKKFNDLKNMEIEIAKYRLTDEEEQFYESFVDAYEKNSTTLDYIRYMKNKWNERQQRFNVLTLRNQQIIDSSINKNGVLFKIFLIISTLFIGFLFVNKIYFKHEFVELYFVPILIGCFLLLLSSIVALILLNARKKKRDKTNSQLMNEIKYDNDFIKKIDEEVSKLLQTYEFDFDVSSVTFNLEKIEDNIEKMDDIKYKKTKHKELINSSDYKNKIDGINSYIKKYKSDTCYDMFNSDLDYINETFVKYIGFKERYDNFLDINKAASGIKKRILSYLSNLGFDDVNLIENKLYKIKDDLVSYNSSLNEYNRILNTYNDFIKNNDIKELNSINMNDNISLEDNNKKMTSISEEIDILKDDIYSSNTYLEELREQYDDIVDDEIALSEKRKKISIEKERYKLLSNTRELLKEAKTAFVKRYVGPISKSFKNYYEEATNESSKKFSFDANTNLTYEEHGLDREEETLSSGYQDIVGICTRFAFIDAMYQTEKPFIILDDPFTNLDKDKIECSLKMLKELSKKYQIVYFTCHDSRL